MKHPTIHSTLTTITPALATSWLTLRPPHQRSLSTTHVERLAKEMSENRWAVNGDAIVFDANNMLFDGQHRLQAVVLSGATISSFVTRGVNPEGFTTKDRGRKRTPGDIFSIAGFSNSNVAAAIARQMMHCDRSHDSGMLHAFFPTPEEVLEYAGQHPQQLAWSVSYRVAAKGLFKRVTAVAATLGYISIHLPADVSAFSDRLMAGSMLGAHDPVLTLRNRLLLRARSKGDETRTIAETVAMFSAWKRGLKPRGMIPLHADDKGALCMPLIYTDENRVVLHDGRAVWYTVGHKNRRDNAKDAP